MPAVEYPDGEPAGLAAMLGGVIEANLAATGFDRATTEVVRVDAIRWAQRSTPVDLAIIDPPYAFEGWPELLGVLDAQVIVCESGTDLDPGPADRSRDTTDYAAGRRGRSCPGRPRVGSAAS